MNSEILQPSVRPQNRPAPASLTAERATSIIDKASKLFRSTDFVRVINLDTEPLEWECMNPEGETRDLDPTSSTVPMQITHRDDPEYFRMEPAQSSLLPGRVAYIMLDVLYKRLQTKKVIGKGPDILPGGRSRNFSFSDDQLQHEFLQEAYLGKELPGVQKPVEVEEFSVVEDLGLREESSLSMKEVTPYVEPKRKPGRPVRK